MIQNEHHGKFVVVGAKASNQCRRNEHIEPIDEGIRIWRLKSDMIPHRNESVDEAI